MENDILTQSKVVEHTNGSRMWYLNDKLHREDGPAVEHAEGTWHWYLNGKRHREDGPAIEYTAGARWWFLNDRELTLNEWLEQNTSLSDEEKCLYKLKYG